MRSILFECTIQMLTVICDMYEIQKMTYREFLESTEIKIQFLLTNMNNVAEETLKRDALDIVSKCMLLKARDYFNNITGTTNICTDIIQ